MAKSFVFKSRTKRPSMTMETLKKLAKGMNLSTLRSMNTRQDEAMEESTWNETLEEEQKRWVWFDNTLENDSFVLIGRRFGLVQSDKTRVIENCSCCGLNWTVGLHEISSGGIPNSSSIDILMPYAIFDYMGAFLRSSFANVDNVIPVMIRLLLSRLQANKPHRNTPEPSEPCLRNLHHHAPELFRTLRNLPNPASGTYTNTRRNSPEPSGTFRDLPEPTFRNLPEPTS